MLRLHLLLPLCLVASLLAGCGQKGPLTLTKASSSPASASSAPASTSVETDDADAELNDR